MAVDLVVARIRVERIGRRVVEHRFRSRLRKGKRQRRGVGGVVVVVDLGSGGRGV